MSVPASRHVLLGISICVVATAIVGGLIVLGPPSQERAHRLDNKRMQDLREIAHTVDLFWTRQARLPSSLDDLSGELGVNVHTHDPDTAQSYDYRVTDARTYELCAEFQRDSTDSSPDGNGSFWSHLAGRQCFQLEARNIAR